MERRKEGELLAKSGMDDEALSIQRAAREIEKLDDSGAQARVAFYLYLRYTAAGDRIAPGEAPSAPARIAPSTAPAAVAPSAAQQPVSGAPGAPADRSTRRPSGPAVGPAVGGAAGLTRARS